MSELPSILLATLQRLTEGLLWMSETDEPFEVFHWSQESMKELTKERLLYLTHHPGDTLVEQMDVDEFFSVAAENQDWFGDEERAIALRYRELLTTLKHHLNRLKVYRVGEVEIDIYILGQTQTGDWVGLATKAVET